MYLNLETLKNQIIYLEDSKQAHIARAALDAVGAVLQIRVLEKDAWLSSAHEEYQQHTGHLSSPITVEEWVATIAYFVLDAFKF